MKKIIAAVGAFWLCNPFLSLAEPYNGKTVDSGDYYKLENGEKVSLWRATEEIAVRYKKELTTEESARRVKTASSDPSAFVAASATAPGKSRTDILHVTDSRIVEKKLLGATDVALVTPVFINPQTGNRLISTGEVIVGAKDGVTSEQLQAVLQADGLELVEKLKLKRINAFKFRISDSNTNSVISAALAAGDHAEVLYAEPNFLQEINFDAVPNDPLYSFQQALKNTGQNGATSGADVKAEQAWNITTGDPNIVIAIIDTGVDVSHPDLKIATNAGETGSGKESNGVDDDGDGYIDDWQGWNFAANNNNPSDDEGHGTSCAGIAAATGNNSYGISGIARDCKVLPVKIATNGNFVTPDIQATAISYAAAHADVLSCSWGGGSQSSLVDAAITDATYNGRGGKGCPVFFASGNAASNWNYGGGRIRFGALPVGLSAGNYYIGFRYTKNASGSAGEDLAKIDNVELLGSDGYTLTTSGLGTNGRQDFEGSFLPSGWSLATSGSGVATWYASNSSPFKGTGGSISARSGVISNNQVTELRTPLLSLNGSQTMAFDSYISSEAGDGMIVTYYDSNGTYLGYLDFGLSGVHSVNTAVAYPASSANSISVGASTDKNLRADYSEYGANLDLVAPSNGGFNDVISLDITGTAGRSSDDINRAFGGTSAACPLAAGIGALMLSVNPQLTAIELRKCMHLSCDKIAGVSYSGGESGAGGRHNEYGYGLINASTAVAMATNPSAYYKMNEPAQSKVLGDSSGNGNVATLLATNPYGNQFGSIQSGGYSGNGLYCAGGSLQRYSNAMGWYVSIPNANGQVISTQSNAPFSIAFWIQPWNSGGNYEYTVATNEPSGTSGLSGFRITYFQNYVYNGNSTFTVKFASDIDGGTISMTSTAIPFNPSAPRIWNHISITYDGNIAKLYVNGQLNNSAQGTIVGNSENLRIASGIIGVYILSGYLDELRFYKKALGLKEVAAISGQ
jgi:subtilisin family serine protease